MMMIHDNNNIYDRYGVVNEDTSDDDHFHDE